MIQAQLGGVDPNEKEFLAIKRQFMIDSSLIFDHSRRLIRCIIDCKLVDRDGVSTRHALDLSRSFSAGFWENSNLQLRQVPQVGPATTRKLSSSNINSIEKLLNLDTATIERIMGRNPPFGRTMLDSLAAFPSLSIGAEITGKVMSKAGNNPKVKIRAHLGYKNTKMPTWNGKTPALTFMAETSDGEMVHFWRGSIQRLTQGQDLKFDVSVSSSEDEIKCQLACDDLVGTLVVFNLKPDLPPSDFPLPKPGRQATPWARSNIRAIDSDGDGDDDFGSLDFEDEEIIAVVKSIEAAPESDYGSDDFADIDNLDDIPIPNRSTNANTDEFLEPVKMENGKWTCNHACRGGHPLKNGQTCKHRCCHEGLDKPRKLRRKVSLDELSGGAC